MRTPKRTTPVQQEFAKRAQDAVVGLAGVLRHQIIDLQKGLTVLSKKLEKIERHETHKQARIELPKEPIPLAAARPKTRRRTSRRTTSRRKAA